VLRLDPFAWAGVSHLAGYDRPFAGLGHANLLGAYLVMGTPLAGALALRAARAGRGTVAAALAAVTLAAVAGVVASRSRGAWVALAGVAALALVFRLSPTRERGNLHPRSRVGLILSLPIALFPFLIVGLLAARADLRSQLFERVRRFGDGAGRVETWQAALGMFREHPLTGVGLDCFQTAYGAHRSLAFWQREYDATPGKAHNEVLHVLATQGLLGGAAGLLLTIGLVLAARRAFRRAASADARLLLTALAAGVVGFSLQSLFGFTVAATGSLFVTLAAVIVRLSSTETKVLSAESGLPSTQHPAPSTFLPAAATALALAAAWPLIGTPYWADRLARAADDVREDSPAAALRGYEAAVRMDPGRDVLWLKLSQGAWSAAAAEWDGAARLRLGLRARAAAEETVALRPALAAYRVGLGRILSGLSRFGAASADDALTAFDAGLALDPRNPHYLALAGEAASDLGRPDRARDYLNRGLTLDPSSAALRAGLGRVVMAERRFDEADAQLAAAVSTDWHGDADGFLTAVALRAACLVELRRPREAAALVRDVVRERPGWPGPLFTLANALAQLGRPEAAPEYRAVVDLAPDHPFAAAARRWLADHGAAR
jgi:O-antigen ligase